VGKQHQKLEKQTGILDLLIHQDIPQEQGVYQLAQELLSLTIAVGQNAVGIHAKTKQVGKKLSPSNRCGHRCIGTQQLPDCQGVEHAGGLTPHKWFPNLTPQVKRGRSCGDNDSLRAVIVDDLQRHSDVRNILRLIQGDNGKALDGFPQMRDVIDRELRLYRQVSTVVVHAGKIGGLKILLQECGFAAAMRTHHQQGLPWSAQADYVDGSRYHTYHVRIILHTSGRMNISAIQNSGNS